jgi:hypothetical protein
LTAANGRANGIALDSPTELTAPTAVPDAAKSSSTAPVFARSGQRVGIAAPSAKPVGPRCGYEGERDELPCGAPATVTDMETGCAFCASHFREVIL